MKTLRWLLIFAVVLMAVPHNVAFAEEIAVKNDLAGINAQKVVFTEPVKRGIYYISFDMLAEDSSADVYCRLLGNEGSFVAGNYENLFDAAAFKNWTMSSARGPEPVFTVFGDMYCDWNMTLPADSKKVYQANEWYEVDIWLDFGKRISTVYLNGEYFDTSKMNENFTALYGFTFYCNTNTREGTAGDNTKTFFKYKNLYYGQISSNYIQEEIENVTIPQYLKDATDVEIMTNKVGNVFFSPENITFDVGLKNKSSEDKSYNISYEVFCEGKSVWQASESVDIRSGRTSGRSIAADLSNSDMKYGFFELKVSLTDVNTNEVIKRETRFSVAKKSDTVNNKMGLNHHHSKRLYAESLDEDLELFYNAGFGADRDGLVWSNYEVYKGEYALPSKMDEWLNTASENNVTAVAILGYNHDLYKDLYPEGEVAAPPVDGEYMEKYKLYVENMVSDTIERVGYYEVWNEWNLAYNNNGREHYTYHEAADYVNLVKVTKEIVDKINAEKGTNAKVLAGGLGYNSGQGTYDFISECIELGICDYSDGISFHPYWAHENPENLNYWNSLRDVRFIKSELDKRNIEGMELVMTELGYPTRENGAVSEIDQAKWMVRSSAYYEGEVDLITWYLGQEKIDNSETECSFGIIRPWTGTDIPYEAKPAYIALANYNSLLAGAELISRSPEIDDRFEDGSYISDEQYTYHFRNDGRDIYMLTTMNVNGGTLVCETGRMGRAELIDMYGNSSFIESDENGVYTVAVANDEPVYILPITQSVTVSNEEGVANVQEYAEGYIFRKDSIDDIILQNGAATEYNVDLSETPVESGIVDVSFRFWPNMSPASPDLKQATQTFEFGSGFSFEAIWSSYGGNASWLYNGWLQTSSSDWKWMNGNAWLTDSLGKGYIRVKDANATAPHAYYDISAKINLDTKKIYLTVVEHLETTAESRTSTLWDNVEYDYNADSFDYYKISFASDETYLQSLNSNLLIKADSVVSHEGTEEAVKHTYSDDYVFASYGASYTVLDNKTEEASEKYVDLSDTPVNKGIVDVSYRFWPNMNSGSDIINQATQTFEFGDGFSFDAKWKSYGSGAYWLSDGKFNIGGQTKMMNAEAWKADAGMFRTKDANATAPHAYYDISAKINLDTGKIYLTIVEHLETTTEEKVTPILDNAEYDYNSDVFDYFKIGFSTEDEYLQSLNSRILIEADGAVSYEKGISSAGFVASDSVIVKSGSDEISTFAEFNEAEKPVIDMTFKNETGEKLNAYLVMAYYKDDVLIKLDKTRNIQISGEYENVKYNYNMGKADVDADSVKVFVWNDMLGIIPIKQMTWLK